MCAAQRLPSYDERMNELEAELLWMLQIFSIDLGFLFALFCHARDRCSRGWATFHSCYINVEKNVENN